MTDKQKSGTKHPHEDDKPAQTHARDRSMPDSVADSGKEGQQAKETLQQSAKHRKLKLNEGGRTSTDGDDGGNPKGSVKGLPRYDMDEKNGPCGGVSWAPLPRPPVSRPTFSNTVCNTERGGSSGRARPSPRMDV